MKKTILISCIIIFSALILYFLLVSPPQIKTTVKENILNDVSVTASSLKKEKLSNVISLVGVIQANTDVNVISETQGLATSVKVKVGDFVKENSVLVEVDDVLKQSGLASAEINYLKSKRDYERNETLYQENSISAAQLDLARLQVKAAETQLTIAKKTLDDTRIKSPITGTVNKIVIEKGTMVQPGSLIANIVDISTLKVLLNISERDAFKIKPGDNVEITTDVYSGITFNGKVDNIAAKADEAHTYAVEIKMPNSQKHPLKAGMFARVTFVSVGAVDVLAIPREALVGSIRNAKVYTVRNNIAKLKSIVIGRQSDKLLEVIDGLDEGELIVINGQNNLTDNIKVAVINQ